MRFTYVVMAMILATSACMLDEAEEADLGDVEQEGTLNQGTLNQGTLNQGTLNQGTLNQGPTDGVWGFDYTNWMNSGMYLKSTSISGGELRAAWNKQPLCRIAGLGLTRSCEWWGAGWGTCGFGDTVTVRAGACSMSTPRHSMVRVCSGTKPCASTVGLGASDAACAGTTNPSVTFQCPVSRKYFVMVAPKATGLSSFSYTVTTTSSTGINPWLGRTDFVGTTMAGVRDTATRVPYRITAASALPLTEDPRGRSMFYTLVEDTAAATPLCAGTDNRAIPLTGRWTESGHVDTSTSTFTMGCTRGAIAKCYRLGYRPWDVDAGGRSLRDYHQTCTRAARADFCGNGTSFTIDGTTIDMYDRLNHVTAASEGFAFEAVWAREQTIGSDDVYVMRGPVCLSKKRWDTLPYGGGGSCTALTDPRMFSDDVRPAMCDEQTPDGWFATSTDTLITTESAFNDAGLWRWRQSAGGDHRSTSECTTTEGTACSSGYILNTLADEPRFIGAIYNRDIEAAALPAPTIPLYSFRHLDTGEYLTTTDPEVAGYGPAVLEGYILDTSCEATQTCPAKRLDLMFGNGEYLTTTPLEPVNGYAYVRTLGYLPR